MMDNDTKESVPGFNLGQQQFSNESFHILDIDTLVTDPRYTKPPIHIFDELVFKNEITVLGGTDNTGKSILGMDILIAAGMGLHYWSDDFKNEEQMKGLLIDTELNNTQFTHRYRNLQTNGNIKRASFWPAVYGRKTIDEILICMEDIFNHDDCPRLVVVDNLSTIANVSSGSRMQYFLSELKRMKELYGLTMILITHLNKVSHGKPVSKEDFRGSKQLTNMADSVIGIGNTCLGDDLKYISLLKTRNVQIGDTVSIVSIKSEPYLHFEFEDDDLIENVLPKLGKRGPEPKISEELGEQILMMKESGLSSRSIAATLGLGKSTVCRFLKQ